MVEEVAAAERRDTDEEDIKDNDDGHNNLSAMLMVDQENDEGELFNP